jgi:para-aminobenzoate synthetase component 1
MLKPQDKYFAILHTSKKTSYTEGRTLIFSDCDNSFTAESFDEVQAKLKNNMVGYLSYDLKNSLEKLPEDEDFFITTPKSWFGNFKNIETHSNYKLPATNYRVPGTNHIKSNMTKAEYLQKVERIRKYIADGDIYQANLTRKFFGEFEGEVNPFSLYCELNRISPAPYSAYIKIDDLHIISSSPELFLRVDKNGHAITCPIKGSMGKGQGVALALSDKDRAENLMITDLMRNDFSRSCEQGSVKVENFSR